MQDLRTCAWAPRCKDLCIARGELPPLPYRARGAPARLLKFRARSRQNLRRPMPISKLAAATLESRPPWYKFHAKFGGNFDRRQRGRTFCRAPWKQLRSPVQAHPTAKLLRVYGSKALRGFESLSLRHNQ